jgi:hypothetical protein
MLVVVDGQHWLRGYKKNSKAGPICLLNRKGKRCCLGFLAECFGFRDYELRDVRRPAHIRADDRDKRRRVPVLFKDSSAADSKFTREAMRINDSVNIGDARRVAELKKLGARRGIEFVFQNLDADPCLG